MRLKDLIYLWRSDLCRYCRKPNWSNFFKYYFLAIGFRFMFYHRLCNYFNSKKGLKFCVIFANLILRHYKIKFGINIPWKTKIGRGFYIGHFGSIVINATTEIGNNCNISHEVTIGLTGKDNLKGGAKIGDNCYFGPGSKVIKPIKIGKNVAIGANCVVVVDIPDNAIVAGPKGEVISYKGSFDLINNTDY